MGTHACVRVHEILYVLPEGDELKDKICWNV